MGSYLFADAQPAGRQTLSFNDHWHFKKTGVPKEAATADTSWSDVTLPHTWNREDMQLTKNFYQGEGVYTKEFTPDSSYKNKRLFLRFEGVGSVAAIYINDRFIGEHKGAYAAFCFEITHSVKWDSTNTITVKANNLARPDVIPVNHFLFGVYGGIYRQVQLIITDVTNITTTDYASPGIYIKQKNVSNRHADINVSVKLENRQVNSRKVWLQTLITDQSGKTIVGERKEVLISPQGQTTAVQELAIRKPHLWNARKDPYLYTLRTSLTADGVEIDAVTQKLGIRSFEIIPGKGFYLNNQPYRLYGVSRHQDLWGYGSALTDEQHQHDLDMIQELGATSIRFAHYQQAEKLYAGCDSMGILAWAEIPFVNNFSKQESENAKQQLTELIRQNYNHPSIYIWGLHNEVYAKNADEYVTVLTRQLNDLAKTEDPDRLTASVSGYGEMNRPANLAADVQGMNRYYGWYEGKIGGIEKWINGLEEKYPSYKLMLTEYGADANINQQSETIPDTKNIDPINGQFSPEGYQTATHVTQWGVIEKHPYLAASYVWNMFDFAVPMWNRGGLKARNLKGLVSFDRKEKKDAFYWYKANWNPSPMVYIAGRRNSNRTVATTTVEIFSNLPALTLFVNDKAITTYKQVATKADFVFENVPLQKGSNTIKAVGTKDGQTYTDTITWNLQ